MLLLQVGFNVSKKSVCIIIYEMCCNQHQAKFVGVRVNVVSESLNNHIQWGEGKKKGFICENLH